MLCFRRRHSPTLAVTHSLTAAIFFIILMRASYSFSFKMIYYLEFKMYLKPIDLGKLFFSDSSQELTIAFSRQTIALPSCAITDTYMLNHFCLALRAIDHFCILMSCRSWGSLWMGQLRVRTIFLRDGRAADQHSQKARPDWHRQDHRCGMRRNCVHGPQWWVSPKISQFCPR